MVWSISLSASEYNMKDMQSCRGSLKVEVLGITGLAKLLEGDTFEVYIKHQGQKFTGRCIVQDGEQLWTDRTFMIDINDGLEILIKVVEIKGDNDVTIGCVSCPTSDFISENPQICIVPINRLGTLKLRLKIWWRTMVFLTESGEMVNGEIADEHEGSLNGSSQVVDEANAASTESSGDNAVVNGKPLDAVEDSLSLQSDAAVTEEMTVVTSASTTSLEIVNGDSESVNRETQSISMDYDVAATKENGQVTQSTVERVDENVFIVRTNTIESISSPKIVGKQPEFTAQKSVQSEIFIPPPPMSPPPEIPMDFADNVVKESTVINGEIYARQIVGSVVVRNVGTQTERKEKERPDLSVFIPQRTTQTSSQTSSQTRNHVQESKPVRQVSTTTTQETVTIPANEYIRLNSYVSANSPVAPPPSTFKAPPETLNLQNLPPTRSSANPSPVSPTNGTVPEPSPRVSKATEQREITTVTTTTVEKKLDNGLIVRKEPLRDAETTFHRGVSVKDSDIVALLSMLIDGLGDVMDKVTYTPLTTFHHNCMKLATMLKRNKTDSVTASIKSALGSFDFLEMEGGHTLKSKKSRKKSLKNTLPRITTAHHGDSWLIIKPAILHHLKICLGLLKFIGVSSGPLRYKEYKAVSLLQDQNNIIGTLVQLWLSGKKVNVLTACPDLELYDVVKYVWNISVQENSLICMPSNLRRSFVALYNHVFQVGEEDDMCQEVCVRIVNRASAEGCMEPRDEPISIFQYFSFCTGGMRTKYIDEILLSVRQEIKVLEALQSADELVVMSALKDHNDIPLVASCLRMVAVIMVTADKNIQEKAEIFIKRIPSALRPGVCNIFKEHLEDPKELVRAGSCICLAKLECVDSIPQIAYLARLGGKVETTYGKLAMKYMDAKCKWNGFPMAM